jgi:protein crumbs
LLSFGSPVGTGEALGCADGLGPDVGGGFGTGVLVGEGLAAGVGVAVGDGFGFGVGVAVGGSGVGVAVGGSGVEVGVGTIASGAALVTGSNDRLTTRRAQLINQYARRGIGCSFTRRIGMLGNSSVRLSPFCDIRSIDEWLTSVLYYKIA